MTALLLVGLLFWQREGAACAFVSQYNGTSLPQATVSEAVDRITQTYGVPQATLHLVDGENAFVRWLFKANAHAVSITIPGKSCIVVGPKGKNIDVIAHELVHTEIANRLGYLAYLTRIPVWFNEGAAMQMDYRPQYDLPDESLTDDQLGQISTAAAFFSGDDAELTKHYGLAKRAVSEWLKRNGGYRQFYRQLELLKNGSHNFSLN